MANQRTSFKIGTKLLMIVRALDRRVARWRTGSIDEGRIAANQPVIGMFGKECELPGKTGRRADIIGIEAGQQGRAGKADQLVETGDQPAVFAGDQLNARVSPSIASGDAAAGIVRTIVEDQKFEVGEALPQHAFDRLGQEGLAVIDAHGNRDGRG